MKKVLLVLIVVFSFFSVSCNLISDGFNASMKDFFDENLGTALIIGHEPQATYYTGNDGYLNIPSNNDFSIKLSLYNPQGYKFELEKNIRIEMIDEAVDADLNIQGDPDNLTHLYDIYSDPQDKTNSTLILHFTKAFLRKWESGGDISPIITLSHPLSDVRFQSYDKLKVRSNSPPPPVSDIEISEYWNEKKHQQCYRITFTMPSPADLSGIHKDISNLEIKIKSEDSLIHEKDWNVKIEPNGTFSFDDMQEGEDFNYGGGYEDNSTSSVSYFSDASVLPDSEIICYITLYDKNGLNAGADKTYYSEQDSDENTSFEITLPVTEEYEFSVKIKPDDGTISKEKIVVKIGGSISFDVVTKDKKPVQNGTFDIRLMQNGDALPLPASDDGKNIVIDKAIPLGMYEIYMSVKIDGMQLDQTLPVELYQTR